MFRLEILPADYGDSLWLEYGRAGSTRVVLIDGGPGNTYRKAIRPRIEALAEGHSPRIELLVVSHIDNDHILGVLDFLGDTTLDVDIGEVWFNGWEQIEHRGLAWCEGGHRAFGGHPGSRVNHNTSFGGQAAVVNPNKPLGRYTLPGGLTLTLLSPGPRQLLRLRDEWETVLSEAEEETTREAEVTHSITTPEVEELAARRFHPDNAPANGSSIALLAEYDGHRLLLRPTRSHRSSSTLSGPSATPRRTGSISTRTSSLTTAAGATIAASCSTWSAATSTSSPPAVPASDTLMTNVSPESSSREVRSSASTRITDAAPICSGASKRSRTSTSTSCSSPRRVTVACHSSSRNHIDHPVPREVKDQIGSPVSEI